MATCRAVGFAHCGMDGGRAWLGMARRDASAMQLTGGARKNGGRDRLRAVSHQVVLATQGAFPVRWVRRLPMLPAALLSAALAFALALGMIPLNASWADEVGDAQATLDEAEARMQSISEECESLRADLEDIQAQIDETAALALEAQDAVLAGRDDLGKSALFEYKGGSLSALVTLVLESANFDDLMRNVSYLNDIMQHQSDEIAAQKERVEKFDALVSTLNVQKSDQEDKLRELEQKQVEAQQVVENAQAQLENAQEAEAARLAALEEAAKKLAEEEQAGSATVDENANTMDREDVVPDSTPVAPNPDPNPPSGSGSGDSGGSNGSDSAGNASGGSSEDSSSESPGGSSGTSGSSSSSAGWKTGVASAYGGSTDKYTPNPGTTATGDVCDDWSMGVAIPMSWPKYWTYYGRTVEISYGGKTVFAVVNDCGYMGGGSRSLDLQPGVWKAFGYSSCNGWGLRTVSYRFL